MGYKADEYKISRKNPRDKLREDADLDFGIYMGEVIVRPKDDSRSGRIPVYIPMLAKDRNDPKGYFNCYWSSPFAGTTPSAAVGDNEYRYQDTMKTYGMWMVPPDPGNFVLVIFADGKKKTPIIIGCMFPDQMQYMVPGNAAGNTFGTRVPMPVAEKNRKAENRSHSAGVQRPLNPYIAFPIVKQGLINDPVRGTTTSSARRESPSQVFGFLTPGPEMVNMDSDKKDGTHRIGGHSFVMDDNLKQRHIRLRTAGGAQLLLDDTNELVYVINSTGTAWVELSADGSVNVFSDENLNMRATSNINIRADHTVNIDGGVRVNINAGLMEDPGGNVDTLKLGEGRRTGGDIYIQSGTSINALTNDTIKLQTTKGGSKISAASQGSIAIYGKDQITTKTPGPTVIDTGGDTFVSTGGSTHIVSSGQSFVKGSTVHLNDGGSVSQGNIPEAIKPLTVTIFKDEPMSVPVVYYNHQETTNDSPIPTDGKRVTDGSKFLAQENTDPNNNYSDERGEKIDVASTTTMITTREPWFGHLKKDITIPTARSQQIESDAFFGDPRTPGTSGNGYMGPDNYVDGNGDLYKGVGFDGYRADKNDDELKDYLLSKLQDANGDSYEPNVATANFRSMQPDWEKVPGNKSVVAAGGQMMQEFTTATLGSSGHTALTLTKESIIQSQTPELTKTPLVTDEGYQPYSGGPTRNCIGYKHILAEEQEEAGVIMFGQGLTYDPTSETTTFSPAGGSTNISAKALSDLIKTNGPGQDLSQYGLMPADDLIPGSSGDGAYYIKDREQNDKIIMFNGTETGMSTNVAKMLLENDLKVISKFVLDNTQQPMSKAQLMAFTMLGHSMGQDLMVQHPAYTKFKSRDFKNVANRYSLRGYDEVANFWYGDKGNFLSFLHQCDDSWFGPTSGYDNIPTIMSRQSDWNSKSGDLEGAFRIYKNSKYYG